MLSHFVLQHKQFEKLKKLVVPTERIWLNLGLHSIQLLLCASKVELVLFITQTGTTDTSSNIDSLTKSGVHPATSILYANAPRDHGAIHLHLLWARNSMWISPYREQLHALLAAYGQEPFTSPTFESLEFTWCGKWAVLHLFCELQIFVAGLFVQDFCLFDISPHDCGCTQPAPWHFTALAPKWLGCSRCALNSLRTHLDAWRAWRTLRIHCRRRALWILLQVAWHF